MDYGTIDERVARGLAWIIEHGHVYNVDIDRVPVDKWLDLSLPFRCVLGWAREGSDFPGDSGYMRVWRDLIDADQAAYDAGAYMTGTPGPLAAYQGSVDVWMTAHGFALDRPGGLGWPALQAAWVRAITEYRATQPTTD
jgi:hypothetical protein